MANPGTLLEGMHKIKSTDRLFPTTNVSKKNRDILIIIIIFIIKFGTS
jgi:hypothetical protein